MKVSNSDTPTQIQLLTLAPQNSSRESISEFFGVSEYIIRESRELLKRSGILGDHKCRKGIFILKQIVITKYSHVVIGKVLSDEVIRTVESFYQDDEYTRQMPGKKDYVSIARNVHIQKRLILSNLHELYFEFKRKYPDLKVGNHAIIFISKIS